MKLISRVIFLLLTLAIVDKPSLAQSNIPIVGADESLSQYICVTTPGVKTFGMKVILANGTVSDISLTSATAQINKQIHGLTKKILNASDLLKQADTKKKREKLKAKIQSLRTQRESVRFIKSQISLCEKAQLEFNVPTVPVLLTNVVSNPTFSRPLNYFMFGFKFTIPKIYRGDAYCVAVSNASALPGNLGGIIYPEVGEQDTEVYKNCGDFGPPIGQLCVNGLEDDEGMIIITQGAFEERGGNCTTSTLTNCTLNEFKNLLTNYYANTRLTSFRAGNCSN